MNTYFKLFEDSNEFVNVMDSLQNCTNYNQKETMEVEPKNDKQLEDPNEIREIDKILSKIFAEIDDIESEREKEILNSGLPIKYERDQFSSDGQ